MQLMHHAAFLRLVLEREVVEQLCRTGLTDGQAEELEQSLARQRALYAERQSYELLEEDLRMHGLFYRYCGRERAGDAFTAIDCDLLRTCYLKIVTYSYQPNVAAARGWESHLTEHRLILDALRRRDYEALRFTVQQHILQVEQEGDHLRRIYPQYFCA